MTESFASVARLQSTLGSHIIAIHQVGAPTRVHASPDRRSALGATRAEGGVLRGKTKSRAV